MDANWILSDQEFSYFRNLIEDIAGISLSNGKRELVRSRLRSRVLSHQFNSFSDYGKYLKAQPPESPEWQEFINLLTTNKTDFFREPKHFDFLVQTFLPEWQKKNDRVLKIWSCASSTGEEPYTLAMVLHKYLTRDQDFKILATDIDTKVLAKASNAVYPLTKLKEIPAEYHNDSIAIGTQEVRDWFQIKEQVKNKVVFKTHNLVEKTFLGNDVFDLIVCRNVLIYFSEQTIEEVASKLYLSCKPGGYLFIGHSESLQGTQAPWQSLLPAIYKKNY
jgi:chemotaxis protein methyltransferase CheR